MSSPTLSKRPALSFRAYCRTLTPLKPSVFLSQLPPYVSTDQMPAPYSALQHPSVFQWFLNHVVVPPKAPEPEAAEGAAAPAAAAEEPARAVLLADTDPYAGGHLLAWTAVPTACIYACLSPESLG